MTAANCSPAVGPEEGGKLAHGRLQSTLPVRAKTRRHTITSDGTPGLLCLSNPGRRQSFRLKRLVPVVASRAPERAVLT
jgi:hypothetical protein